ncbi:hypothetical protein [Sphingobacterium sp. 1.A.4]|uniref:hypothetical protein n=1 Tax=Sphingobacterium sp. 1.A.4 TaxID=2044603 RepID=UPI000C0BF228|nr:hypothetical protein [Sphingobacterium sp. 1.A.4]
MKKFTLIFRTNQTAGNQPSEEQMKFYMDSWMKWINDLSEKGKLADVGNSFYKFSQRMSYATSSK